MSTLRTRTTAALVLSAAALLPLAAIVLEARHAFAHSWYPEKCCGGQDCHMVDRIDPLPDGDEMFHAGAISVVVPIEFKRLPSQDNRIHVCVYTVRSGEYRPRCVFVPGQS
jgi:hypothetical protein